MDGVQLEQVSEFKYLVCVLNELGTDDTEWLVGGNMQVPSDPGSMLEVCSLSV